MLRRNSFDYAVVRIVPRVERAEFVNTGVIVFCAERQFLRSRVHINETRLQALWPDLDVDVVRRHVEAIPRICAGTDDAGPLRRLSLSQRFHWLVAPRSTMIQISPVHCGLLCGSAEEMVDRLFDELVALRTADR
jgi:hypothetical protein